MDGVFVPLVGRRQVENAGLTRHPAFQRSTKDLYEWGVRFVFDPDRRAIQGGAAAFPWPKLCSIAGPSGEPARRLALQTLIEACVAATDLANVP